MKTILLTLLLFSSAIYAFQGQDQGSESAKKELEQIEQQIKELQLEGETQDVQETLTRQNKIKELQAKKESIQVKYDMYIKYENGLITYIDSSGEQK